jgi:hypothetical protein
MVKELKFNFLQNPSNISTVSLWWNKSISQPKEMGFVKNRATRLHSLGWATIEDVWVVTESKFASIEEMGDKFILSLAKKLAYGKIATKLE